MQDQVKHNINIVPVTVIIPCYRCANTIERSVESVYNQSFRPAEVILVEDGSQDGTLCTITQLVNNYEKGWLKVIALPSNIGAASARNIGWSNATKEFVALLDADDTWHPNKIQVQYTFMSHYRDVDVSGHVVEIVTQKPQYTKYDNADDSLIKRLSKLQLLFFNKLATPTVMFKRELPFRFLDGRRYVDDHLLWMQMVCRGVNFAKLDLPLAHVYKAMYGEAGLSRDLWRCEKNELINYYIIWKDGCVSFLLFIVLIVFSFCKYLRRVVLVLARFCC